MTINYQDKNLIVMYLQIFLKEYFGTTVRKVIPASRLKSDYYEITSSDPIKVTGYWNLQSYSALALYIAQNFPNEGFPYTWTPEEVGTRVVWNKSDSFNENDQNDIVFHTPLSEDKLLKIISNNMEYSISNKQTVEVPERILSYVFNEVVTPSSTPEEILRIKRMIYTEVRDHPGVLKYSDQLGLKVKSIQQKYIDDHTISGVIRLPDQYKDFKVTGYVDPWTEVLIKGDIDYEY